MVEALVVLTSVEQAVCQFTKNRKNAGKTRLILAATLPPSMPARFFWRRVLRHSQKLLTL